jgi:hypothetical protein
LRASTSALLIFHRLFGEETYHIFELHGAKAMPVCMSYILVYKSN